MPDAQFSETYRKTKNTAHGVLGKLDRCAVPVTVVNILFSLIMIIISIYIVGQASLQHQPLSQEVCIDCADLTRSQLSQQEVNGFSRRLDNDTEMCCAENQEQMTALLIASMREQEPDTDVIGAGSIMVPVSAHKRLFSTNKNDSFLPAPHFNGGKKHFHATFNTSFNDPLTEHVHGVEVLDSALRINYTGLYYVYFSYYLGPEFDIPAKDFDYQSWLPYVFRESRNNPDSTGRLLQTSYTAHGDSIKPEETVYTGGTFNLLKGDELQVCISGLGLVRYIKEASFIGVFKLSSDVIQR